MELSCDIQVVVRNASNHVFHERTKHCHFIRENIKDGLVLLLPVRSDDQLADLFTKSSNGCRVSF